MRIHRSVRIAVEADRGRPARPVVASRAGFSLFEVLIALTIFAGSVAAIGQLVSGGVRAAMHGQLLTQAVIRCESKMAELVAGVTPVKSTGASAFSDDSSWTWSVTVSSGPLADLYLVEVTASHPSTGQLRDLSHSLTRLVRDPANTIAIMEEELLEEEAAAAAAATSSTTTPAGGAATGGGAQ